MTLGPTVRTTRGESTGSPGSRRATLVSQRAVAEAVERSARAGGSLACVAERVGDGDAAGRDGEDEPVAVLAGQLHRARAEARDVERDLRLEAEILRVVRQHPDGTDAVVVAVV